MPLFAAHCPLPTHPPTYQSAALAGKGKEWQVGTAAAQRWLRGGECGSGGGSNAGMEQFTFQLKIHLVKKSFDSIILDLYWLDCIDSPCTLAQFLFLSLCCFPLSNIRLQALQSRNLSSILFSEKLHAHRWGYINNPSRIQFGPSQWNPAILLLGGEEEREYWALYP